ncbi:MAG: head-tail adaptor protein [Methanoregulaceae archaeon]|nr:head-tail adaptor protein [Methanoregulaceae archaeon]
MNFNQRIKIQKKTVTRGAMGNTESWSDVETVWGLVVPISVSGLAAYSQAGKTEITHKLVFRSPLTLNLSEYRFVYDSETYIPQDPPVFDSRYTTILVKRV